MNVVSPVTPLSDVRVALSSPADVISVAAPAAFLVLCLAMAKRGRMPGLDNVPLELVAASI